MQLDLMNMQQELAANKQKLADKKRELTQQKKDFEEKNKVAKQRGIEEGKKMLVQTLMNQGKNIEEIAALFQCDILDIQDVLNVHNDKNSSN